MIRPIQTDDRPFVLSGWSASLRATRDIALIPMKLWSTVMRPIISAHLNASTCLVDENETLRGFIVFDPARPNQYVPGPSGMEPDSSLVLYCYVAEPYRRWGLARGLFEAAGIDPAKRFRYACRTKGSWLCRGVIPHAVYDPFAARFKELHV